MIRSPSKNHKAIASLLFILALSTGCRTSSPLKTATAEDETLSPEDRIAIFEDVWKTINEEYYDPSFHGVNWREVHERYRPRVAAAKTDIELYSLFELMLAELRDAHTVFTHPQSKADNTFQPTGSVGVVLGEAENRTVIVAVEPDSDAARAGVRPGMVLRTVNGKSVEELYAEIRSQFAGSSTDRSMTSVMHGALLYGGFLGASRTFGIEGFDGKTFDVPIIQFGKRPPETPSLKALRLPSGDGYLGFDGWKPPVDKQFRAELVKLGNAPGLIIDLRGNGGGQTDTLLSIGSLFFPNEVSFGSFRKRDGVVEEMRTQKTAETYNGSVVILVDDTSASASELFAVSMQENGRARVIGQPTCGCVLNQWSKNEKGGGTLKWSARAYTSPRGRILEGTGVIPDEKVGVTISDLREGKDLTLGAAEKALRNIRALP
jgi:carboxyl-terminal processing protease